jgi:hypothetical protein
VTLSPEERLLGAQSDAQDYITFSALLKDLRNISCTSGEAGTDYVIA